MKIKVLLGAICLLLAISLISLGNPAPAFADNLSVISYNVESDNINDTNPSKVAEDIEKIVVADLWGFSEVANQDAANIFLDAVAFPSAEFNSILGTTGASDKLQIVYNKNVLKLINSDELDNSGGTRSPLFARFEFIPNGQEFLFMVNHFNRGDEAKRQTQAKTVREWAKKATLPVIAVGDYNFDFDIPTKTNNKAFDIFLEDNVFEWIQPQCLSNGNCPDTGTQCDSRFNSILDFIFVANGAKKWTADSEVLFLDEDICARERNGFSDHRPVIANIDLTKLTNSGGSVTTAKNLRISSLLPNPVGDEAQLEAATIQNIGDEKVDLTGWRLRDLAGNFWNLDLLGSLHPGENELILRRGQSMALNNDGDTVELLNPNNQVVDTVTYSDTREDVPIFFD